jgi:hypothetical protein
MICKPKSFFKDAHSFLLALQPHSLDGIPSFPTLLIVTFTFNFCIHIFTSQPNILASIMHYTSFLTLALAALATAHTAVWAPGMYCRGGADATKDEQNTNLAVNPLYNLEKEDWWFQHHRGCDAVPPKAGEFLEVPANGEFTVELAHNRAFTTLSYNGRLITDWPDGKEHPEDWNGYGTDGTRAVCLKDDGALHTYNESSAGGTAFAISYHSEIKDVTMENLVVFTTLDHTPWKRLATYKVPDLAACPEGGCTCAWLWIPNGCGEANM